MSIFIPTVLKSLLPIGLFGVMGIFLRYFIGLAATKFIPSVFPYGTFLINIIGSFLIGIIFVLGIERTHIAPVIRLGLTVGFLGGFTTFSAYSLEAFLLFERGKILTASCYFVLSPIVGIIFTFIGAILARKLF